MGLRDRLRIERIKQGWEVPRSVKRLMDVEKSAQDSVKGRKLVTTKCPDITNLTEVKSCLRIMGLFDTPKMPQSVICTKTQEGMYKVVAKLKKAGETSEFIFKFYWGIPEFRQLWDKLGYVEGDWRQIANS